MPKCAVGSLNKEDFKLIEMARAEKFPSSTANPSCRFPSYRIDTSLSTETSS